MADAAGTNPTTTSTGSAWNNALNGLLNAGGNIFGAYVAGQTAKSTNNATKAAQTAQLQAVQAQQAQSSNMLKYVLIGAAVLVGGIVLVLVLRRK